MVVAIRKPQVLKVKQEITPYQFYDVCFPDKWAPKPNKITYDIIDRLVNDSLAGLPVGGLDQLIDNAVKENKRLVFDEGLLILRDLGPKVVVSVQYSPAEKQIYIEIPGAFGEYIPENGIPKRHRVKVTILDAKNANKLITRLEDDNIRVNVWGYDKTGASLSHQTAEVPV